MKEKPTKYLKMSECHYPDELIKNCVERAKTPFTNRNAITGPEENTLVFVSTYIPNLSFDKDYIRKRTERVQTKRPKQAFNNTITQYLPTDNQKILNNC